MSKLTDHIKRLLVRRQQKQRDRSDHLRWKLGDIQVIRSRKRLSEDLAPAHTHELGHTFETATQEKFPVRQNMSLAALAHYNKHSNALSEDHKESVREYKSSSQRLNENLREGKPHPDHHVLGTSNLLKMHQHLDTITSHRTPEDHVVYRGFAGKFHPALRSLRKGDVLHDKGYTSTTFNPSTANAFSDEARYEDDNGHLQVHKYLAKIHVPKGSKAHYLDNIRNKNQNERELLLHHGSKFEVLGHSTVAHHHDYAATHYHIVHLRLKNDE